MYNINEVVPHNLRLDHPYTIEVQVMFVQSRSGSEVIKHLSEKYPFSKYSLTHLKRAKKSACKDHLEILIGPKDELEELSDLEYLSYNCTSCGMFKTATVPRIPPYTKKQLKVWTKLWPCIMEQPSTVPYFHLAEECEIIFKLIEEVAPGQAMLYVPLSDYKIISTKGNLSFEHCIMMAINHFEVPDTEYLCTNAYAIAYYEPCIMCAMALVHSRVQRVYFIEDSEKGAYSYWKLHERSVNYMYRIFKITPDTVPGP
jgi:tRNA-specific adenosine deaminase 3